MPKTSPIQTHLDKWHRFRLKDEDKISMSIKIIQENKEGFRDNFIEWIQINYHVYAAFEREALRIAKVRKHYSAYTIMGVISHETIIAETDSEFKISHDFIPDNVRLFRLFYPEYKNLFSIKRVPTTVRGVSIDPENKSSEFNKNEVRSNS